MTRQVTDNLYIELDYFTPEEYYTYEAVAASIVTAEFTQTATAGVIKDASVAMSLTSTVTATISHIEGADLFAFTEASMSVISQRIKFGQSTADSAFALSAEGIIRVPILHDASAALTTTATLSGDITRISRTTLVEVSQGAPRFSAITIDNTTSKWGGASAKIHARSGSSVQPFTGVFNDSGVVILTGGNNVWRSSNSGVNWTKYTDSNTHTDSQGFFNNQFVTTSSTTINTSLDGITWTSYAQTPSSGYTLSLRRMGYINGYYITFETITGTIRARYSTDLVNWTIVTLATASGAFYSVSSVHFTGTKLLVLIKTLNSPFTYSLIGTTNGTSWAGETSGTYVSGSSEPTAVAGSNNAWVMIGNGKIYFKNNFGSPRSVATTNYRFTSIELYNGNFLALDDPYIYSLPTNGVPLSAVEPSWTRIIDDQGDISYFNLIKNSNTVAYYNYGKFYSSSNAVNWNNYEVSELTNLPARLTYTREDNSDLSQWSTIDLWYYPTSTSQTQVFVVVGSWIIDLYSLNSVIIRRGTVSVQDVLTKTANTWHHLRLVRNSSQYALYINGSRRLLNSYVDPATSLNTSVYIETRSFTTPEMLIDELLITDELLTDPSVTSFSVPTGPYTNTVNTDLLLHFDTGFDDDATALPRQQQGSATLVGQFAFEAVVTIIEGEGEVVEALGSFSAEFSQSTVAGKIINFASALTAEFTQTATISHIEGADLSAFAEAQLSASAEIIKSVGASLSAEINQTVTASVVKQGQADLTSEFAQTALVDRIRNYSSQQSSEVTQVVNAEKIAVAEINVTAEFTQTATISHIEGADLFAFAEAQLSAQADRIRNINADTSAESNLAVESLRIKSLEAQLVTEFNLTAIADKFGGNTISLTSNFALESTALKLLNFEVALTSTVNQDTTADRIVDIALSLTTEVVQTAQAAKTVSSGSTMSAEFTQTATISHIEGADLFAFAEAQLSAQVDRLRDNNIQALAAFDLATSVIRIQQGSSAEEAFTFITTDFDRIRSVEAAQVAAFSTTVDSGRIKSATAELSAEFTQTVTATVTRTLGSELSSNFNLVITASPIRQSTAALISQSEQTAVAVKTTQIISIQTAETALISTAVKTVTADSAFASETNVSTVAVKTITATIITDAVASALVSIAKVGDFLLTFETNAVLSVEATKTISALAPTNLSSSSAVAGTVLRVRESRAGTIIKGIKFGPDVPESIMGEDFIAIKSRNPDIGPSATYPEIASNFLISFWANDARGAVLDTGMYFNGRRSTFTFGTNTFTFRNQPSTNDLRTVIWSGINTSGWHHYAIYQESNGDAGGFDLPTLNTNMKFYVDGIEIKNPAVTDTDDGSSPPFYGGSDYIVLWGQLGGGDSYERDLTWTLGADVFSEQRSYGSLTSLSNKFTGGLYQFAAWFPYGSGTAVPDARNPYVLASLFDGDVVDLGAAGTSSGLRQPDLYFIFDDHTDLAERGRITSRFDVDWLYIDSATAGNSYPGQTFYGTEEYVATAAVNDSEPKSLGMRMTSSLSATAQSVLVNNGILSAQFTQTATVRQLTGLNANIASEFSQQAQPNKIAGVTVNAESSTTVDATILRIKSSSADLATATALSATVGYLKQFNAELSATSTLAVNPIINVIVVTPMEVEATVYANVGLRLDGAAELFAQGFALTLGDRSRLVTADLATTTELLVNNVRTRDFDSELVNEVILIAEVDATVDIRISTNTTSTLVADANMIKGTAVSMSGNSTVTLVISKFTRITANFTAFNAQLTAGRVIHLDPLLTWRIEPETRLFKINDETRVYSIEEETRIIKIKGYVL